jgi:hypothetical protein
MASWGVGKTKLWNLIMEEIKRADDVLNSDEVEVKQGTVLRMPNRFPEVYSRINNLWCFEVDEEDQAVWKDKYDTITATILATAPVVVPALLVGCFPSSEICESDEIEAKEVWIRLHGHSLNPISLIARTSSLSLPVLLRFSILTIHWIIINVVKLLVVCLLCVYGICSGRWLPNPFTPCEPSIKSVHHKKHIFVDFNAWVYNGSDVLWASLMLEMLASVQAEYNRSTYRLYKLKNEIAKHSYNPDDDVSTKKKKREHAFNNYCLRLFLLTTLSLGLIFLGLHMLKSACQKLKNDNVIVASEASDAGNKTGDEEGSIFVVDDQLTDLEIVAIVTSFVIGMLALSKVLTMFICTLLPNFCVNPTEQLLKKAVSATGAHGHDFSANAGFMGEVKKEMLSLSEFLQTELVVHKGAYRKPHLSISIDDLDRCDSNTVVQVLRAVTLLLEGKGEMTFWLAIDPQIVVSAVDESYGDSLKKAGVDGVDFLDKIIQLPFCIPRMNRKKKEKLMARMFIPNAPSLETVRTAFQEFKERIDNTTARKASKFYVLNEFKEKLSNWNCLSPNISDLRNFLDLHQGDDDEVFKVAMERIHLMESLESQAVFGSGSFDIASERGYHGGDYGDDKKVGFARAMDSAQSIEHIDGAYNRTDVNNSDRRMTPYVSNVKRADTKAAEGGVSAINSIEAADYTVGNPISMTTFSANDAAKENMVDDGSNAGNARKENYEQYVVDDTSNDREIFTVYDETKESTTVSTAALQNIFETFDTPNQYLTFVERTNPEYLDLSLRSEDIRGHIGQYSQTMASVRSKEDVSFMSCGSENSFMSCSCEECASVHGSIEEFEERIEEYTSDEYYTSTEETTENDDELFPTIITKFNMSPEEWYWIRSMLAHFPGKARKMKKIFNVYNVTREIMENALTLDDCRKRIFRRKIIKAIVLAEMWPQNMAWILQLAENALAGEKQQGKRQTEKDRIKWNELVRKVHKLMGGKEDRLEIVFKEVPLDVIYRAIIEPLIHSAPGMNTPLSQEVDTKGFEYLLTECDQNLGDKLTLSDIYPLDYAEGFDSMKPSKPSLRPFLFNMQDCHLDRASIDMSQIIVPCVNPVSPTNLNMKWEKKSDYFACRPKRFTQSFIGDDEIDGAYERSESTMLAGNQPSTMVPPAILLPKQPPQSSSDTATSPPVGWAPTIEPKYSLQHQQLQNQQAMVKQQAIMVQSMQIMMEMMEQQALGSVTSAGTATIERFNGTNRDVRKPIMRRSSLGSDTSAGTTTGVSFSNRDIRKPTMRRSSLSSEASTGTATTIGLSFSNRGAPEPIMRRSSLGSETSAASFSKRGIRETTMRRSHLGFEPSAALATTAGADFHKRGARERTMRRSSLGAAPSSSSATAATNASVSFYKRGVREPIKRRLSSRSN